MLPPQQRSKGDRFTASQASPAMIQPDKARDENKKGKENTVAEAGRPMPNYLMDFLGELMK